MGTKNNYGLLKNYYYWLAFLISYVFPFLYFFIKLGITKQSTKLVIPVVVIIVLAIVKLGTDIPKWVATWEPSFKKGIVKATPKLLLFIMLITLGLTFKYIIEQYVLKVSIVDEVILAERIDKAFLPYFETVFVLFGSMAIGSIFEAFHLKYKELYLLSKGYVLGVVNK